MIKNITIGQYYPVESFVHRLDSRIKLLGTLIFIASLFVVNNIWGYMLAIISLSIVVYSSKVPPRYLLKGLKGIIFIIAFTAIINAFFTPGDVVIFSVFGGKLKVTTAGIIVAIKMCLRLSLLIIGSSLLTLTTPSTQLTDAIEFGLKPLKKVGVPSHEIAMMMTIAIRFIPVLMEEMDKIMKAQTARGADFETGNIIQKAKSLVPLLVPLFVSAFRRAYELATAMEARCYRGDINRTRMKEMKFNNRDYKALISLLLFLLVSIFTRYLSAPF